MGATKTKRDQLEGSYVTQLEKYLSEGGEEALEQAYELGRRALGEGMGVLDVAAIHQQAFLKIMTRSGLRPQDLDAAERAGEFFAQTAAPFEMTHRAFGEANQALSRINEALEAETRRIAYALHDQAGQLLAAAHIALDEVARGLPISVRERLQEVRRLLDQVEGQLRQISHELRPTVLDDFGLVPALELLAEGIAKRTRHRVKVEGRREERLPPPIETALYRIVQEALNNASKHARASRVTVRLERSGQQVLCSVADNGVGFDTARPAPDARDRGLGLVGIRERLNALGGTLEIRSQKGRGTELSIAIPLEGYDASPSVASR